jgi:hypothetical protein
LGIGRERDRGAERLLRRRRADDERAGKVPEVEAAAAATAATAGAKEREGQAGNHRRIVIARAPRRSCHPLSP